MSSTSGSFFEFLDKKFEQAEYGDRNARRPTHPESSDLGVIDQMTVARTSNGYHDVTSLYLYPEGIHIVRSERNGNSKAALDDKISFSELDSIATVHIPLSPAIRFYCKPGSRHHREEEPERDFPHVYYSDEVVYDRVYDSEVDSFIGKAREALARYEEHFGTRKATTKANNNTTGEPMAQANNSASNQAFQNNGGAANVHVEFYGGSPSGDGGQGGEPKKKSHLGALVAIISAIVGITGITLSTLVKPIYVPDVVGMAPDAAEAAVSQAGLWRIEVGEGETVISQDPAPNTGVPFWTKVTLECGSGLDRYSWDELANASAKIAAADSDNEAISIAAGYGLCSEDGTLDGTQTRSVTLSDGTEAQVRVVGFRHDELSDGGTAGITWAFCQSVGTHQYNTSDTNVGGWAASSLRRFMNDDLYQRLPDDLRAQVKRVEKPTNNTGATTETSSVTYTSDLLWVPSAVELLGDVGWWTDDNGSQPFYDDIYNAEGSQYQLYSDQGLNYKTGKAPILQVSGGDGSWWLRSPNPYQDDDYWGIAVYVGPDGHCHHSGKCSTSYGVVPYFCI